MNAQTALKRISKVDRALAALVTVTTGAAMMAGGVLAAAKIFLEVEETKAIKDAPGE
ncbi:MAG TPA: hypothetical protein VLG09_06030 [Candidatus Saccharimonadales bacterium]|nr:hypothetical protein [Candidatus Saccharimonadales bacterium]